MAAALSAAACAWITCISMPMARSSRWSRPRKASPCRRRKTDPFAQILFLDFAMNRYLLPVLAALLTASVATRADNPVVQTKFTADPAPVVVGDTVYLFTSHDEDD